MTIQWFPGHMAKARREVTEKLKLVDVVFELVDARLPLSSRNPMMLEITQGKPRVVLLNKSDLADPSATEKWVRYFQKENAQAIEIVATKGEGLKKIEEAAKQAAKPKLDALLKKGIRPRPVRALILGIPNVGKSSLINRMAKRNIAKTGDRPGITQAQQWIKVGKEFELLDTPGILWPKFEDPEVGLKLAVSGAIKDQLLESDLEEITVSLLRIIRTNYSGLLESRYQLSALPDSDWEIVKDIGKHRGMLKPGGEVHERPVCEMILREFRAGQIGRISLETPENLPSQDEEAHLTANH